MFTQDLVEICILDNKNYLIPLGKKLYFYTQEIIFRNIIKEVLNNLIIFNANILKKINSIFIRNKKSEKNYLKIDKINKIDDANIQFDIYYQDIGLIDKNEIITIKSNFTYSLYDYCDNNENHFGNVICKLINNEIFNLYEKNIKKYSISQIYQKMIEIHNKYEINNNNNDDNNENNYDNLYDLYIFIKDQITIQKNKEEYNKFFTNDKEEIDKSIFYVEAFDNNYNNYYYINQDKNNKSNNVVDNNKNNEDNNIVENNKDNNIVENNKNNEDNNIVENNNNVVDNN